MYRQLMKRTVCSHETGMNAYNIAIIVLYTVVFVFQSLVFQYVVKPNTLNRQERDLCLKWDRVCIFIVYLDFQSDIID